MRVGFKQIAIFDTQTVSKFLHNESISIQEFCNDWIVRALALGADAIVLRDSLQDKSNFQSCLDFLISAKPKEIPLICNHKEQTLIPQTQGVHYKRGNTRGIGLADGYAGISAHSKDGCRNAERNGFDYVFISPIFPTISHPGEPALGLDKLSRICATVRIPVFALGGITEENMKSCFVAGAHGTASISFYMPNGSQ